MENRFIRPTVHITFIYVTVKPHLELKLFPWLPEVKENGPFEVDFIFIFPSFIM